MSTSVLHVIDSFNSGGSERQAVQLARLLSSTGRYTQYIACLNREGDLFDAASAFVTEPITEFRLNNFYDLNMIRQIRRFSKMLRVKKIDVVHTHDFYTNIFGMFGSRVAGTSVRIASRRETSGTRSALQKRVERIAYNFSHAVIANATAVSDQLVREGIPKSKTEIVYNGVDAKFLHPPVDCDAQAIRQRFGLPADKPIVVLLANLKLPVKNHRMFLKSAQVVRAHFPNAAFVFAGEGPLTGEMRGLASDLGLDGDVFFTGRVDDVPALLRIASIGVLTSTAEGFSNSILEYMASGLPVVATDVGGAREAIRDDVSGFLVEVNDHQAMARRIVELLGSGELRSRMGGNGRAIIQEQFSTEAQLAKTESLYERMLSRTGRVRDVISGDQEPKEEARKVEGLSQNRGFMP